MQPSQFQELLDKYSRGECTPEEIELVHDWYDRIGGQAESDHHELPAEEVAVGGRIWAAVNPSPLLKKKKAMWLVRAAIISIPLLACIAFYLSRQSIVSSFTTPAALQALTSDPPPHKFVNPGKSPIKIELADGSKVILKAASELFIDKDFGKSVREVRLEGAAYFKVKPDPERPFVVFSNEVVTKVLGTSFSVQAYDSESEITVAVRTGKVSVYANEKDKAGHATARKNKEVILTPNQKMVYYRGVEKVSKGLVEKPEIILPNSNLFRMQFENAEVSEIFDVLAANYGVDIRYDRWVLQQCKLTTRMSDEGLYERIEVICKAIGASYSIGDDAVITIKSNGC